MACYPYIGHVSVERGVAEESGNGHQHTDQRAASNRRLQEHIVQWSEFHHDVSLHVISMILDSIDYIHERFYYIIASLAFWILLCFVIPAHPSEPSYFPLEKTLSALH